MVSCPLSNSKTLVEMSALDYFMQECSLELILSRVIGVLEKATQQNDCLLDANKTLTVFHSKSVPAISLNKYIRRISRYADCSSHCFLFALVYFERLHKNQPDFVITSLCIHRLLLAGVLTAAKFFDDIYYSNSAYAGIGGVSNAEMNRLELALLFLIDFNLQVTESELISALVRLNLLKNETDLEVNHSELDGYSPRQSCARFFFCASDAKDLDEKSPKKTTCDAAEKSPVELNAMEVSTNGYKPSHDSYSR